MTNATSPGETSGEHRRQDMTLLRVCPQCGSNDTYRSHRKFWEHFLFSFRPYRCKRCKRRFYSNISSHDLHL